MRNTITTTTDDLNGQEGATTISFAIRGRAYEIDLVPANEAKLDKALAPFIDKARRATSTNGHRPSRQVSAATRADHAAVRAWAAQNGIVLGDRGRIPASVQSAYDAATR